MTLMEEDYFIYKLFTENVVHTLSTHLDQHIDRIKKGKEILKNKINNSSDESKQYLVKQLDLLDARHKKLSRHNTKLKREIKNAIIKNAIDTPVHEAVFHSNTKSEDDTNNSDLLKFKLAVLRQKDAVNSQLIKNSMHNITQQRIALNNKKKI